MFNSGITAQELINQVKDEADIALPIADINYVMWINAAEQLLYTELIKEQRKIELSGDRKTLIISDLAIPFGEAPIRFEDIHAVYADNAQLIKSTLASGNIFSNTYYKNNNSLVLSLKAKPQIITLIYYARPALKTEDNASTEYVKVPCEFTDLIKAKLRGEAYKIANEDALAAKWINDYNTLLEIFKAWLSDKQPEFGL